MIDRTALVAILERITADHLPDEIDIVRIEGPAIVDEALSGSGSEGSAEDAEEFRFGGGVIESIQVISLIGGTVKVVLDLADRWRKSRQRAAEAELTARWKEALVTSGLEPALAESIVSQFGGELHSLLEKSK